MSIQQVGTRETLASAIKTDAFKWTWDSWTHWQARKENVISVLLITKYLFWPHGVSTKRSYIQLLNNIFFAS